MPIKVGDKVPSVSFKQFTSDGLIDVSPDELFPGKRVLLFAVPGAYTPVCHANHLPGYVAKAAELMSKGIDEIVCISVNDPFVMRAWGDSVGAASKVRLLADSAGSFTKETGFEVDCSSFGLGTRSERYAMVVQDGVVELLEVEDQFVDHDVSSADHLLTRLAAIRGP